LLPGGFHEIETFEIAADSKRHVLVLMILLLNNYYMVEIMTKLYILQNRKHLKQVLINKLKVVLFNNLA